MNHNLAVEARDRARATKRAEHVQQYGRSLPIISLSLDLCVGEKAKQEHSKKKKKEEKKTARKREREKE